MPTWAQFPNEQIFILPSEPFPCGTCLFLGEICTFRFLQTVKLRSQLSGQRKPQWIQILLSDLAFIVTVVSMYRFCFQSDEQATLKANFERNQ